MMDPFWGFVALVGIGVVCGSLVDIAVALKRIAKALEKRP
jgi:hypothetical protein